MLFSKLLQFGVVCDMSVHSVWHVSTLCVTCQYTLCDMSVHSVWHVSTICVTCQYTLCDMSVHSVWHVSTLCVTCQYTLWVNYMYIYSKRSAWWYTKLPLVNMLRIILLHGLYIQTVWDSRAFRVPFNSIRHWFCFLQEIPRPQQVVCGRAYSHL